MEHIKKQELVVNAKAGSLDNDCINEAIILAIKESVIVTLTHNATEYTINPFDIIGIIKEEARRIRSKSN